MTAASITLDRDPAAEAEASLEGPSDLAEDHYAWLRGNAPVFYDERQGGYVVSGYPEARAVLGDVEAFRSPRDGELEARHPDLFRTEISKIFALSILNTTGDTHRRLRDALIPVFGPARMKTMRTYVEQVVNEIFDDIEPRMRRGEVIDFHQAISLEVPQAVVGDLIGVPVEERAHLRDIASSMGMAMNFTASEEKRAAASQRFREIGDYFDRLIEQREIEPRDDLITMMVASANAGAISKEEARNMCYIIQLAGYDTTVSCMDSLITTLLAHPELGEQIADDRSTMRFIDEILRWRMTTKTANGVRYANEDIEIGGVTIPKDGEVFVIIGSTHYDERVFPEPEKIDFTRRQGPSMTFGTGVHSCVGFPLAKLEMMVLLQALRERMPDLVAAGEPVPQRQRTLVQYKSIPVTLPQG